MGYDRARLRTERTVTAAGGARVPAGRLARSSRSRCKDNEVIAANKPAACKTSLMKREFIGGAPRSSGLRNGSGRW